MVEVVEGEAMDIMIDLESLGTNNDSVITQIGACYFDRYTGDIGDKLSTNVEINSCLERGLTITGGSIKFWLERKEQATFLDKPVAISKALSLFTKFVNKKAYIWSHATFDPILLASSYRAIGQGLPYSYRNLMDIRTLVNLSGIKYEKPIAGDLKSHDALDDCLYQVKYCVECFKALQHTS